MAQPFGFSCSKWVNKTTNLSHSHLSLAPSLEGTGPGRTWGEGYNLFSLSKLAMTAQPKANWPHLETGPALVRTALTRQQLSNTFRERYKSATQLNSRERYKSQRHSTPWQLQSGLVFVTASHLYPCSLVPFTNPWQPTNQPTNNAHPQVLSLHRNSEKLIAHLLHPISGAPKQAYSRSYTQEATYQQISI